MSKAPNSRFAFYWEAQRGKCALMITANCRAHGGQMTTEKLKNGRQPASHATWDHIYTKPRTAEQEPVQVLACAACNNKRGNAPARAEYVARGMMLLEEWLKTNPSGARGVPNAKRERRRINDARRALKLSKANTQRHPKIPLASPGAQMMATLSRAERNAQSQAAALSGISERLKRQGQHEQSQAASDKAAAILAAVRGGKPPERK